MQFICVNWPVRAMQHSPSSSATMLGQPITHIRTRSTLNSHCDHVKLLKLAFLWDVCIHQMDLLKNKGIFLRNHSHDNKTRGHRLGFAEMQRDAISMHGRVYSQLAVSMTLAMTLDWLGVLELLDEGAQLVGQAPLTASTILTDTPTKQRQLARLT